MDEQTLLFVADDLRRVAESYFKSAEITMTRIEGKRLKQIGRILIERAEFYERVSQGQATL